MRLRRLQWAEHAKKMQYQTIQKDLIQALKGDDPRIDLGTDEKTLSRRVQTNC